jgi:hypothetical protein
VRVDDSADVADPVADPGDVIAVRTSTEASNTIRKVEAVLPAARAWRNRRTMFSTSMMASSTTTPIATTSPARTMTLTVAPAASRIRTAATRESGMAIRLMKAVRHSNKKATKISTTSPIPQSMAVRKLPIDCSMAVASLGLND